MESMRTILVFALVRGMLLPALNAQEGEIPNRLIDYPGFMAAAGEVRELRAKRRLTEEQFIAMSKQEGTIVLDARSPEKYRQMHIEGAVNLNFSDISEGPLEKVIPSRETRILIYCNNNFENAPRPFPTKQARASLNIPTFITLYVYGYRNVYELGPVVDPATSRLTFSRAN